MNYDVVVWTPTFRLTGKLHSVFPCQFHVKVKNGTDFGQIQSGKLKERKRDKLTEHLQSCFHFFAELLSEEGDYGIVLGFFYLRRTQTVSTHLQ